MLSALLQPATRVWNNGLAARRHTAHVRRACGYDLFADIKPPDSDRALRPLFDPACQAEFGARLVVHSKLGSRTCSLPLPPQRPQSNECKRNLCAVPARPSEQAALVVGAVAEAGASHMLLPAKHPGPMQPPGRWSPGAWHQTRRCSVDEHWPAFF